MASTYLTKTFGTATDRKKFTVSLWFKRSKLSSTQMLFAGTNGSIDEFVYLSGSNNILAECASGQLVSSAVFRDTNAWYHVVYKFDSAQATAGDRTALYVNGTEISYSTETQPSQNATPNFINNSNLHAIGSRGSSADALFDGSITHFHFCDGYAYDASAFGETDATTGIWKPKTAPSVTYGTNGFFLKFENSGSMGTDSSGNANNLTVNGNLTQTVDTPSNVFATFNATKEGRTAASAPQSPTFSQGNTTASFTNTGNWTFATTTLAVSKGKWYAEMKCNTYGSYSYVGLNNVEEFGTINFAYLYRGDNGNLNDVTAYGSTWTTGDILQIAFDADNGTLWYGKNGTWQNSATQSEIENGTTTNAAASSIDMTKSWLFSSAGQNGSVMNLNTGNGYFGTTPVSSATSDESGLGIFEYTVPSGYYALCTKNINTQEYA